MKFLLLTIALVSLCVADEAADLKKRGVQKNPSPLNTIPSNGHQKPENPTYVTHHHQQQVQQPQQQGPVYQPVATNPYHQEGQQAYQYIPQQHHQAYNFPVVAHPVVAPKYQLISSKLANGQTQLTLVPQGLVMAHYMPHLVPVQHPQTTVAPTVASGHHYATPQPQTYPQHYYNPLLQPQPSTMFIYTQPAPQLYGNYLNPNNYIYSQAAQQLLHYYQNNPQAKYQLLYGNTPQLSGTEYEKAAPVSQNLASSQKPDTELNTNEYLAPPETSYRPGPVYSNRNYKN